MSARGITNCGECLFFSSIEEADSLLSEGMGECRFRAPAADPFDRDHNGYFPIMNKLQGCGSGTPLIGEQE